MSPTFPRIVLHTNLGRAPLAPAARDAVTAVAAGYCSLEYDLAAGKRGDRGLGVEHWLTRLTGAEAACVVNNGAGAILLVLASLAAQRKVLVSRGEPVEIGGSFRIPDVMARAGTKLREVGTTNRTHLRDYRNAITPDTAILLRVHTSNYNMTGFTKEVSLEEPVALGREHNVPVVDDLGSGALIDLSKYGLPKEPRCRYRDQQKMKWTSTPSRLAAWLLTLLTTKGDLLVSTGAAVQRKAAGTNGYVLTADSSQADGLLWKDVTTLAPTYPTDQPNPIINGSMDIWQRGTAFAGLSVGNYFSADRWEYRCSSTGVVTINHSTDVPSIGLAGVLLNYSLEVDVTTALASPAGGDYAFLQYTMEGYDWRHFAQRDLIVSFFVKSPKTGILLKLILKKQFTMEVSSLM